MLKADCIVRGTWVVTADENDTIIENGAVAVNECRIVDVGPYDDIASRYRSDKIIGGLGRAVIPGLINTHTHAAMVFLRGMADDLPLTAWLQEHIWPAESQWLSSGLVYDSMMLACLEMIKAGVTTMGDMYFFEDAGAEAVKMAGMRAVLGAGILDMPTKTSCGAEDCLRRAEEFIGRWRGDTLVVPALAPHSAYGCGPETLVKCRDLAHRLDALIHIHVSETQWEVGEVQKKHGQTPGAFLEGLGLLSGKLLAAHCVWLTEEEIETFAKRGVAVSHCMESNLKLASGIAPVQHMLNAGLMVSLGTDGAASNNDLNVMSEMATVAKVHKAISKDPTVMDSKTVFRMATCNGAKALGISDIGCIMPGYKADLAVINMQKPHLTPMYNIYSHLVYSAMSSDVESVVIDGRQVLASGRHVTVDEEDVMQRVRAWADKIRGA